MHAAIDTFVKELRAGGPMRSSAAQPKAAPAKSTDAAATAQGASTAPAAAPAVNGTAATAEKEAAAAKKEATAASSGHSIKLKERFYAGAAGRWMQALL